MRVGRRGLRPSPWSVQEDMVDRGWCSETGQQVAKPGCAVHLKAEKFFGKVAGVAIKAEIVQ